MKFVVCTLLMGCLLFGLMGCGGNTPAVSEPATPSTTTSTTVTTVSPSDVPAPLTLTGRVLRVEKEDMAVLMECIGTCPLGERVWVQLGRFPDLTLQVGETYIVTYEDIVMPSLPPRITAVTVEPYPSE